MWDTLTAGETTWMSTYCTLRESDDALEQPQRRARGAPVVGLSLRLVVAADHPVCKRTRHALVATHTVVLICYFKCTHAAVQLDVMNVYIALNLRRTFQHQCSRQDSKSWWGKSKLASCPYSTDLVLHQYRLEFTTFHAQNRAKYRQWHVSVYRLCMLFATTAHLPAGSFPSKMYDDTILSHSSFALSCSTSTKSNLGQQKIVNWIILYMQGHLHVCTCNIYINTTGYTEQGTSEGFAKITHYEHHLLSRGLPSAVFTLIDFSGS